jgi:hypothetical protein
MLIAFLSCKTLLNLYCMFYPEGRKGLNYIDKIVKLKDQMLKRHLIFMYLNFISRPEEHICKCEFVIFSYIVLIHLCFDANCNYAGCAFLLPTIHTLQ